MVRRGEILPRMHAALVVLAAVRRRARRDEQTDIHRSRWREAVGLGDRRRRQQVP